MLLANLGNSNPVPTLDVQVLLGSPTAKSAMIESRFESTEVLRVFAKHELKYFYLLDQAALSFVDGDNDGARVLSLPDARSARFVYKGRIAGQHVFNFSLPDYGVETELRVPIDRTFYQAGIKLGDGMVILKMRAHVSSK